MNDKNTSPSQAEASAPDLAPEVMIEEVSELNASDLEDLCEATDMAIESGGGFGWVKVPAREVLERFWNGVMIVPDRKLFVGRLDGIIGGTGQLIMYPASNEAQSFSARITNVFVAPWARGHGIATKIMRAMEERALKGGIDVLDLDVRETQKAAINLYEKMGFETWGIKDNYARIDNEIVKGRFLSKVINPDLK